VTATTVQGNLFEGRQINNLRFVVLPNGAVLADGGFGGPADFAEMLPASGAASEYEPGDVLVIGPDGKIGKSSKANSPTLAGVYSTKPGFVGDTRLQEGGIESALLPAKDASTWLPVALLGIVPVKVTDENGPIHPGDMLTTSALPGCAMRAKPVLMGGVEFSPTGTIIGKALEPLASGKGKIKVLVLMR
jgi:hypothetical protein